MTPGERRYTDDEFALVLRKAAELEPASAPVGDVPTGAQEGLTLQEMTRIAEEVGIAPELVVRALASIDQAPRSPMAKLMGGPVHMRSERLAAGALTETVKPRVLAEIRRAAAHHGVVVPEPGAMVWRSVGQPTQVDVTLAPEAGGTNVTVAADRSGAAGLVVFGSFAGWLVAAGITGALTDPAGVQGVALILAALGAGGVTAQTLWRRATQALQARMLRVESAVVSVLQAHDDES